MIDLSFETSTVSGTSVQNVGLGGAAYNGLLVNGASISTTDSRVGSASLQLVASSSQYMKVSAFSTGKSGLSFAFWFRSSSNADYARLFDFGNGAGSDNIVAYIYGGNLAIGVLLGSAYDIIPNSYSSVNDNVWRHFVWTISVTGAWTVYINGVVVWTATGRYYPNTMSRSLNYIGKSNANDPYFTGAIDEFRVYAGVLAQADVTALSQGKRTCVLT